MSFTIHNEIDKLLQPLNINQLIKNQNEYIFIKQKFNNSFLNPREKIVLTCKVVISQNVKKLILSSVYSGIRVFNNFNINISSLRETYGEVVVFVFFLNIFFYFFSTNKTYKRNVVESDVKYQLHPQTNILSIRPLSDNSSNLQIDYIYRNTLLENFKEHSTHIYVIKNKLIYVYDKKKKNLTDINSEQIQGK